MALNIAYNNQSRVQTMPVKRIDSISISKIESKETILKASQGVLFSRLPSFTNLLIMLTIIAFCGMVFMDVRVKMKSRFEISQNQAKTCLIDFGAKSCNPLGMDEQCKTIWKCIQQISDTDLTTKLLYLFIFSYQQIKENGFFPATLIVLILLYQIAKSTKSKQEPEKHLVQ